MSETAIFNLQQWKLKENFFVLQANVPTPGRTIKDEISTESSDNIYLGDYGPNKCIIWSTTLPIYLNKDLSHMSQDLSKMYYTDFLNIEVCNYKRVKNMHTTFASCHNLNMRPLAPNKADSLYGTYYDCYNLIGNPKVGTHTKNLIATYYNCHSLTGNMQNSQNVISMVDTYYNCFNIVSTPPQEISAKTMYESYYNCTNIYGNPSNCNNAYITINAYYNCANIYGEFFWCFNGFHQARKVNMTNMFYGRNYSNLLTIFAYENYAIANALLNYSAQHGNLYGTGAIDWTQTGTGVYFNSAYNTQLHLLPDDFGEN